jgi:hypothetical protein
MDGLPFADTQTSLFDNQVVFNSIRFTELGTQPTTFFTATGVSEDGRGTNTFDNCTNFTNGAPGGGMEVGGVEGGALYWMDAEPLGGCDNLLPVVCMGRRRTAPVAAIVTAGKKIWVSTATLMPAMTGGPTPNQVCQSPLPAGVTTAAALISTTATPAANLLVPATNYVRLDGTLVGTGATVAAGAQLASGIWQMADGTYLRSGVTLTTWTGSDTPAVVGTATSTCANWTTAGAMGRIGITGYAANFWWSNSLFPCTAGITSTVYCVQTAP